MPICLRWPVAHGILLYFVDAAGLIKRLLTVNPAKRANIIDVAAHWWVNYGHRDLLADLELSEKRTSDYFDEDDQDQEPVNVVFDSKKKPKKSILKNRKMSAGDSGCALSDPKECELSLAGLHSALNDVIIDSKGNKTQCIKTEPLKENTTSDSSKRHSISSNSSTDMLDFSYDSSSSGNGDSLPGCQGSSSLDKKAGKVSIISLKTNNVQSSPVVTVASPVTSTVVYSCSL